MNKRDLESILELRAEAEAMRGQLQELERIRAEQQTEINLSGTIERLRTRYTETAERYITALENAETLLSSLSDRMLSAMLRYRFLIGLSWEQIASRTGSSADACRMKIKRFLSDR